MAQREIKFRAWVNHVKNDYDHDTRQWSSSDRWMMAEVLTLHVNKEGARCRYITEEGDPEVNNYDIGDNCVIMQYTGLKDKDGRELWEGDVRGYPEGDASVFVVEFRDGAFCANYGKGEDGYDVTPRLDRFHLEESVHLGNIYENPEVIEA